MPVEFPWHRDVFPLPPLEPIAQGHRLTIVGDRADPLRRPAGYPVIGTRLEQGHDATSGRAGRARERTEHAVGGDEHGVRTTPNGGTKFFDDRQLVVGRTGGADDDGERAVGTAGPGRQRAAGPG